jgi:hypothetical protein
MDTNDRWERRKYEPDSCPLIEAKLQRIDRELEKNDISYRQLSEAMDEYLTESEISDYLERKIHMSFFWVGAEILETISDIILRRYIQGRRSSRRQKK